MADFEDPKDRIEEGNPASNAGDTEKRPLGFEQEPSPDDPGRRLVLKFALLGAAAALLPKGAEATGFQGTGMDPGTDPGTDPGAHVAVDKPYSRQLSFQNQPGVLSNGTGAQGQYSVSGGGDLYIDAQGHVILSNIQATGLYVSGALNRGTISVVQPTPSIAGTYSGTQIQASTTVLYTDSVIAQKPSALTLGGNVYKGGSNITVQIGINGSNSTGIDWEVRISWPKATC